MTEPSRPVLPAMILAAGYGSRLHPLTEHLPKPLLPILERSLLEVVLDTVTAAGCGPVAVNTHHHGEMVAEHLRDPVAAGRVQLFPERDILGTGGALHNAREFLAAGDSFLLHNGDVLCDAPLADLLAEHDRRGAEVTLLLVDWAEANTVRVAGDGAVTGVRLPPAPGEAPCDRALTYTGIAVFRRSFLDRLPAGASSLPVHLRAAVAERPGSIRGFAPEPLYWNDVGTVARYLDALDDVLAGQVDLPGLQGGSPLHVAPDAVSPPEVRAGGFLAVGSGARVGSSCRLEDCVVLPGGHVPPGTEATRAVFGAGWVVTEAENARHNLTRLAAAVKQGKVAAERITGHGSERRLWRVRAGGEAAILMQSPADDPDFDRFLHAARFLHAHDLGGPRLLAHDPQARLVLMEDLGRQTLHDRVTSPSGQADSVRKKLYPAALDRLVELQTRGTRLLDREGPPTIANRLFDRDTLRWETDYFRERFLEGLIGLAPETTRSLDADFERLADLALEQPAVLIHRDFQSQNLVVTGDSVRLVDFQGMRRGPLLYDVMSLLRDAYIDLGRELRHELLATYGRALAAAGGPHPGTEAGLARWAVVAGLQRNMQALGAFGFLSREKGKRGFLAHVPLGLRHLEEGLEDGEGLGLSFPGVREAVDRARARVTREPGLVAG